MSHNRPKPFRLTLFTGLICYATFYTWGWRTLDHDWFLVPYMRAFFSGVCLLQLTAIILHVIYKLIRYWFLFRPKGYGGTASFASSKENRKAGLHKKTGFLVGLDERKKGVFVEIESSGFVLSPAGGGKTTGFVVPALCHITSSMIVPDYKGTLAVMTAKYRKKKFKHECITINPAGLHEEILGPSASYNLLIILIDNWNDPNRHVYLMDDARGMAKQISPDPPSKDANQYFRNGARKYLVFVLVYVVIFNEKETLTECLALLSDEEAFIAALEKAKSSDVLSGDLSLLAKDILTKKDKGKDEQLESFREGAVQALEIYSRSGTLAKVTEQCDFRFADLRKAKKTIYQIADPTRQSVYAPWLGLLLWCALTELIRSPEGEKVCALCDEATNFRIEGLPGLLTMAREYHLILWVVLQELAQWSHIYGPEALETLLSQTEAKLLMGLRSPKSCQLASELLGEESIKTKNYAIGASIFDPINRSVHEQGRKLKTPDEVRRETKSLLIYKKLKPVQLDPIGYHEITPWKHQIGINPLYGKKFKGRTRLRV